jgi:hypothetical protein
MNQDPRLTRLDKFRLRVDNPQGILSPLRTCAADDDQGLGWVGERSGKMHHASLSPCSPTFLPCPADSCPNG